MFLEDWLNKEWRPEWGMLCSKGKYYFFVFLRVSWAGGEPLLYFVEEEAEL